MNSKRKTLILGIGNVLLQDEGAGIHAIRQLADRVAQRDDIDLMDGGTLSFTLTGFIEDADNLIVIDAAQYEGEPGTTRVFVGEKMDDFIGSNRKCSVHEVSLIDLMAIALLTDQLPHHRALIGIQPQTVAWGETTTPDITRAIKLACEQAIQLVEEWRT